MVPNITRGSHPAGLVRYLFSKGRANEHRGQHVLAASQDMHLEELFDLEGRPRVSFRRIGERFDAKYRVLEGRGDPFPPDRRGRRNPSREPGRDRVWHCSLAIKAGQTILTDQRWADLVREYLRRMNLVDGQGRGATWMAVRHGLSKNGNDHVHLLVQLADTAGWINPWHDRIRAQATCRAMEEDHADLQPLRADPDRTRTTYQYEQWRAWAEWKARAEYTGDVPFERLDASSVERMVNRVAADTMPRQALGILVAACARASASEDEFIRRVRREGLHIDPRLRRGVRKDSFTTTRQVVGYTITWRSADGWSERFNAHDLGADLTLGALRKAWAPGATDERMGALEWQAAMVHGRPVMRAGRERQPRALSAHDMSRLIDQAFSISRRLEQAKGADGRDVTHVRYGRQTAMRRDVFGYLFQDFALIDNESVQDNLDLAARPKAFMRRMNYGGVLRQLGLLQHRNDKVFVLSGGEQQRLALGRLLVKKCQIILADEPTADLDEGNATMVISILRALADEGRIVLMATHSDEVAQACDTTIKVDQPTAHNPQNPT